MALQVWQSPDVWIYLITDAHFEYVASLGRDGERGNAGTIGCWAYRCDGCARTLTGCALALSSSAVLPHPMVTMGAISRTTASQISLFISLLMLKEHNNAVTRMQSIPSGPGARVSFAPPKAPGPHWPSLWPRRVRRCYGVSRLRPRGLWLWQAASLWRGILRPDVSLEHQQSTQIRSWSRANSFSPIFGTFLRS